MFSESPNDHWLETLPLAPMAFPAASVVVKRGLAAILKRIDGPPVARVLPNLNERSRVAPSHVPPRSNVLETASSRLYWPESCGVSIVCDVFAYPPGTSNVADCSTVPLGSNFAAVKKEP
jgi:hypothetical protein